MRHGVVAMLAGAISVLMAALGPLTATHGEVPGRITRALPVQASNAFDPVVGADPSFAGSRSIARQVFRQFPWRAGKLYSQAYGLYWGRSYDEARAYFTAATLLQDDPPRLDVQGVV